MARGSKGAKDPGGRRTPSGRSSDSGRGARRSRPWLLPTIAIVAGVIVIAAIVYTIVTGQRFF
jgi:hypothetical protein